MYLTKEYLDSWMKRLLEQLKHLENLYSPKGIVIEGKGYKRDSDGDTLLDNYDLCQMLNVSKRTLQRYRSSGDLPYQMIYHKTFYKESDVLKFIEINFDRFRAMKKLYKK